MAGVVTHRQRPESAGGAVFLNLEDETGLVNVICSRGAWVRWRHVARSSPALLVRGRLERVDGSVSVVGRDVHKARPRDIRPSRRLATSDRLRPGPTRLSARGTGRLVPMRRGAARSLPVASASAQSHYPHRDSSLASPHPPCSCEKLLTEMADRSALISSSSQSPSAWRWHISRGAPAGGKGPQMVADGRPPRSWAEPS